MSVEPSQIYQSMMLEIKIRIRAIDSFREKENGNLSSLNIEFCFLQTRKIIEQICFSSILCDENRYKDFRTLEGETSETDKGNYKQDWNSRIIFTKLKDISPHFMSIPLGNKTSSQGFHHFDRSNVNATHTKLIKMYKKCSSFMHIPKPFAEDYKSHIEKQRQKYNSANETIKEYATYLKELLWNHITIGLEYRENDDKLASIENANPKTAWIIGFGNYDSNEISVTVSIAE